MKAKSSAIYIMLIILTSLGFVVTANWLESEPTTAGSLGSMVHWVPSLNDGTNYWIGQILPPRTSPEDLRHKPYMFWRTWASKPLPVLAIFPFILVTNAICCYVFPKTMLAARAVCLSDFWRSLLIGICIVGGAVLLARCLFISGIGNPLAITLLGGEEVGMVFGFAVTSTLLGRRLLNLSGLSRLVSRPVARTALEVFTGAFIVALLNLIPGVGLFQPFGLRLVGILGMSGMGATVILIRSKAKA